MSDQEEITPLDPPMFSPRFLSALTHELCTPLGSVLMLSEMMAERGGGTEGSRQAKRIHQAALDIQDLIDQVSLLARIAGGRLRLDRKEVKTAALARALRRELASRQDVAVAPDAPTSLIIDPKPLIHAVRRLLVSVDGGEATEVAIECDLGREGGLLMRVRRPVEGVTENGLGSIFDPFHPAARIIGRRHGGQSLDLTIARALVELLGGSISAALDREGGVVFSLSFA